ncbi:hypothetical protein MFIFM68171_04062 [Madurella fahalii]|uniref:Zn(2)-C6 fungal-type domain-containing protein n=1 Tax=Madurella fahalii TaxID=1157608 RepID=A0ABQ0G7V9_9PEZI
MATSKPRQPRLRASCDGCFIAKVKCSKARPICSRCLTCGIECRYSPSSRAGKPKSDASASSNPNTQVSAPPDTSGMPSPVSDDKSFMYAASQPMTDLYKLDTGWNTPPTSVDGGMSRSHSMSSLGMMGMMNPGASADPTLTADIYTAGIPWTPPGDVASQYVESPAMAAHLGHGRSHSYDLAMPTSMWGDANAADMYGYGQAQMGSSYFPNPVPVPQQIRSGLRQKSSQTGSSGGSCTCFTACLQSLQALHNASVAPTFDMVVTLNRKAIEGCAVMLTCARCMSRSGTHTAAMLLATVIGKIASFYKTAFHMYFEDVPNLGGSIGQFTNISDRWLELEILARELRKLDEVYAQFRDAFANLSDDPEVSKAMIGYLNSNIGSTLEVIQHRKSDGGTYT